MTGKVNSVGLGFVSAKPKEKKSQLVCKPIEPAFKMQKVSTDYSVENLKANFLTFTGHKKTTSLTFGSGSYAGVPASFDSEDFGYKNISDIPDAKKFHIPYYEQTANDVAVTIGPDKHALLLHDEGVTPELLVHKFEENLHEGKYLGEGLGAHEAKVFMLDAQESLEKNILPHNALGNIMSANPQVQKVVFVKDFESMMAGLVAAKINPKSFFKHEGLAGTQVIGLMPKKSLEPKTQEQIINGEKPFPKKLIEDFDKIEFNGLGSRDTKRLLKKDARFTNGVLDRYPYTNLTVSEGAIDAIVDKSAQLDGAFPGKALKVLDLAAASKMRELSPDRAFGQIQVRANDVDKLFKNHASLLAGMRSETSKRFSLAENVSTKLSDVGGIKDVKENIEQGILAYIKEPKKFLASGQKAPKGILMHGEPGTGKTLIARAVAGEAGVPFIAASGSEFVEKYVGVGAQRVRELFSEAKKAAVNSEKKTAIVFIDEIDAIGKKRSGDSGGSEESAKALNQLLTEMDGFNNKESNIRVIVMAATNREDILDPALKRPGRFDDVLEVPAPSRNEVARREILHIHAKGKPFADEAAKNAIINDASKMTKGMSGAEIAEVMNKAAKIVAKREDNKIITHNDVVEGFLQVAVGPMKKSDLTPKDKKMIVRHEGGHAVVIDTLKHDGISFITLDERGEFLGAVFKDPSKEMPNFKSVISSVATNYAGGLAEPGFDSAGHGAGVSQDVENATKLIQKAVTKWSLGIHTPPIAIDEKSPFMGTYSKEVKKDMELFSRTGRKVAKMVVDFHKDFLDDYVDKYEKNAGKGGNNLSGEAFSKMRAQWVKDAGKEKEFAQLQKKIAKTIHVAKNSKKGINKLLFRFI